MTEEEINIAIAEHLGWCDIFLPEGDLFYIGKHPGRGVGRDYQNLPNYTRDLNAIHKAEMSLPVEGYNGQGFDGSRSEFRGQLRLVCEQPYHATAKERAEAFLRTVGKWKEEA